MLLTRVNTYDKYADARAILELKGSLSGYLVQLYAYIYEAQ